MASKVDAAILALTAMWQAATTTTLSGVQVVDGTQANSDAASSWLFVGSDGGTPTEDVEAATAEQSWMAFAKTKQEDAEVTCAAVVVRGDTDIPSARARLRRRDTCGRVTPNRSAISFWVSPSS